MNRLLFAARSTTVAWERLRPSEIPPRDPGKLFDRALTLLLEKVEKSKLGAAARPRPCPPIRPGTDNSDRSCDVPRAVQRVTWKRDGGQCAFVSPTGRRCSERTFLEFHHIRPHAKGGPPTVANISLRCWRHNQYISGLLQQEENVVLVFPPSERRHPPGSVAAVS